MYKNFSVIYDNFYKKFGQEITVVNTTQEYCPTCGYNPVSESGLDPNCPTCHGTGLVTTETKDTFWGKVSQGGLAEEQEESGVLTRGKFILIVPIEKESSLRSSQKVLVGSLTLLSLEFEYIYSPFGQPVALRVICENKLL